MLTDKQISRIRHNVIIQGDFTKPCEFAPTDKKPARELADIFCEYGKLKLKKGYPDNYWLWTYGKYRVPVTADFICIYGTFRPGLFDKTRRFIRYQWLKMYHFTRGINY